MATYELPYAEDHLPELFQAARNGEEVIIVRFDGLSCQLLPLASVIEEEPSSSASIFELPDLGGELVPA